MPGERIDEHGPGIGLGAFSTWAKPDKEYGPGGGYWIEAGYSYKARFFKFPSMHVGMHRVFYPDNEEDLTMYLDFTFLFVSAGPLAKYRNSDYHYGGFVGINIPILYEPFCDEGGGMLMFPYFQIRAEFAFETRPSYYLGFMYKFDYFIFYREVKFDNFKKKPSHSEKVQ
jgi:hypothetical protein